MRKMCIVGLFSLSVGATGFAQPTALAIQPSPLVSYAVADSPRLFGSKRATTAALCDLEKVAHLRQRKTVGALIMLGGAGVSLLGVRPGQGSSFKYPLLGASLVGVGGYLRYYGGGYESLWSSTLDAVKVGKTTRAEVVDCLGSPSSTTTGSAGDVATWVATKPGVFSGGSYRTASIAFRANVVSDVKNSDTH